jgi:mannose-6-phosphate isomerase-like protein (cupin superfamily)
MMHMYDGQGTIIIGDENKIANKNDEFFIHRGVNHQIKTANSVISILEISFADFDEDDIVRLTDKYSRNVKSYNKINH